MTGLVGFSSGYHAMMDCDTLLMVGTDFPYRQFYPADAKVAQIDLRLEQIGRRCRVDLGVVGDVATTLEALLSRLEENLDRDFLDRALAHYRDARRSLDDLAVGQPGRKPIHPQYLARVLDEVAADDATFTCDVGTPTVWAARSLSMNGRRRLFGSFWRSRRPGADCAAHAGSLATSAPADRRIRQSRARLGKGGPDLSAVDERAGHRGLVRAGLREHGRGPGALCPITIGRRAHGLDAIAERSHGVMSAKLTGAVSVRRGRPQRPDFAVRRHAGPHAAV